MEELQDAIEDAQYVNAIATQEEGPRPVLSWEIPTEEQLAEWYEQIRKNASPVGPEPLSIDWCLHSAIGLFLFSAHLKEFCDDYLRINFCEEVIRWRRLRGKHRLDRAKKIVEVYLKELPVDEVTGERVFPEKTQIDEYDLIREPPNLQLSDEEFKKLCEVNLDDSTSKNCLGLQGPSVEEIHQTLKSVEKSLMATTRRSTPTASVVSEEIKESGNKEDAENYAIRKHMEKYSSLKELTQSYRVKSDNQLPDRLFDKVDAIVTESLRSDYWQGFLECEEFIKLKNFLWFQDRSVVPDDFFTMRVLGRGGFGSVIGECSL
jgi:hypothetical protein